MTEQQQNDTQQNDQQDRQTLVLIDTHIYGPPFMSVTNPELAVASLSHTLMQREAARQGIEEQDEGFPQMVPDQALPARGTPFWKELDDAFGFQGVEIEAVERATTLTELVDAIVDAMRKSFPPVEVPAKLPFDKAIVEDAIDLVGKRDPKAAAVLREAVAGRIKPSGKAVKNALEAARTCRNDGVNRALELKRAIDAAN